MTSRTDSNTAVLELPLGPCTSGTRSAGLCRSTRGESPVPTVPAALAMRPRCLRVARRGGPLGRHRDPGVGAPAHFRALRQLRGLAERNGYPVTLNPARYTLDETA